VVIGTDCIDSCKFNYHTIMATTVPTTKNMACGHNQSDDHSYIFETVVLISQYTAYHSDVIVEDI